MWDRRKLGMGGKRCGLKKLGERASGGRDLQGYHAKNIKINKNLSQIECLQRCLSKENRGLTYKTDHRTVSDKYRTWRILAQNK